MLLFFPQYLYAFATKLWTLSVPNRTRDETRIAFAGYRTNQHTGIVARKTGTVYRLIFIIIGMVFGIFCHGSESAEQTTAPGNHADYVRPSTEEIHSATRTVLQNPDMKPKQSLGHWFQRKLHQWEFPSFGLSEGTGKIIYWIILIWCVVTLAAILGHFIWSYRLVSSGGQKVSGNRHSRYLQQNNEPDINRLYQEIREFTEAGRYTEAVRRMLAVLLRRMEAAHILNIESGKTNGEYVREYIRNYPEDQGFPSFVRTFNEIIYGAKSCTSEDFARIKESFERIQQNGKQRTTH